MHLTTTTNLAQWILANSKDWVWLYLIPPLEETFFSSYPYMIFIYFNLFKEKNSILNFRVTVLCLFNSRTFNHFRNISSILSIPSQDGKEIIIGLFLRLRLERQLWKEIRHKCVDSWSWLSLLNSFSPS